MTASPTAAPRPSLGVGKIIGDSFSVLFSNLLSVLILGFIPTFVVLAINFYGVGAQTLTGDIAVVEDPSTVIIGFAVSTLLNLVVSALVTAFLVLLAYDAKLGRPIQISRYINPALRSVLPIAVLSLVIGILAGIGLMLLVIPGLLVYAIFYVTTPAIVIEGAGFGGMGRSAKLTKEYRWPIVGLFIVIGICSALVNFAASFLIGIIGAGIGANGIFLIAIVSLGSALSYGLLGIAVALAYARLREIKDGVSLDNIADVFD